MKKRSALLCCVLMIAILFCGCGEAAPTEPTAVPEASATPTETTAPTEEATEPATEAAPALEDGFYLASFDTDSSMFHVNEACEGKVLLYSENGQMSMHLIMPSKNVVNLFLGSAEDAQADGARLIQPMTGPVTYSDGMTETVYTFDVPVPVLDEEFDLALVGTKGKWYDHKVSVSNPVKLEVRTVNVALTGGSGRASVESPAVLVREADGTDRAVIRWSSPNYEYMMVGEDQFNPINHDGNSTFLIPVTMDEDMAVSALTVAMSEPHLIDYTLHFDSGTIQGE